MQQMQGDKAKLYIEYCEPQATKHLLHFWLTKNKAS
jgi:hypothetical protein